MRSTLVVSERGLTGLRQRRQFFQRPEWVALLVGLLLTAINLLLEDRARASDVLMVWLVGCIVLRGLTKPEGALALLAFAIPFEFVFFGWGNGRYNTLLYPAVLLMAYWLLSKPGFLGKLKGHEWAFLAFAAWSAVTLAWSPDPLGGVRALSVLVGSSVFLLIYPRVMRHPEAVRNCLRYLIAGVLVLGLYMAMIYERTTLVDHYDRAALSRFAGGDEVSAYEYGNAAVVALFGALAFWEFEKRRRDRYIALLIAVALTGAVTLTLGRAIMIDLALCFVVWAIVSPRRSSRLSRLIGVVAMAAVAVTVASWINPGALDWRWTQSNLALGDQDLYRLTSGRTYIWSIGLTMFYTNPYGGVGIGQFMSTMESLVETGGLGSHSEFLRALAETGVPGVGLYVLFIAAMGLLSWRTGPWRHITMAWWMHLVVQAVLNGSGRNKAFWVAAGLTVALASYYSRRPETEPAQASRSQRPTMAPTSVGST